MPLRARQVLWLFPALAVMAVLAVPGAAAAAPDDGQQVVNACTPDLVYGLRNEMDARSTGSGFASNVEYSDVDGNSSAITTADIEWSARAILEDPAPRRTGVGPGMSGALDLTVDTALGDTISFHATCIAAVLGYPEPFQGFGIWANGMTRGWSDTEARRTFVHFEVFPTSGGNAEAYVALVDGTDCKLNFDGLIVTEAPFAVGTGTFSGLATDAFVFAETDCTARFGSPRPRFRAPGGP